MDHQNFINEGTVLPLTATLIQVTNVLTPYIMRISEIKGYKEKLHLISKKLSMKRGILFDSDAKLTKPKLGDMVVVSNKLDIELDTWLCRGYISNIAENLKDTYNVFLPDHGISILLQREDFIIYSPDLITEKYLSYTVGLYNILPAVVHNDSTTDKKVLIILEEWSKSAIQYTRKVISISDAIYFDHLGSDQCDRPYGEFYLIIDNNVLRLSDALTFNNYAVYLDNDLLKVIKNPKSYEMLDKKVIDSETIFYMNIKRECKTINENQKHKEKSIKPSFLKKKKHIPIEIERDQEKVLIYTEDKCEYLDSTLDAKFPLEIHKAWRSLVNSSRPRKIQSYIWPAIKKGLDVIAVGIAKSGKTFGYTFALCGLLVTIQNLPQGVNPSALILCSSSSEVLEVHYLCMELLQSYKNIKSVAAINGKPEKSLVAEMFNGCQILISTPRFLARFLDQNIKLLNFQNLRYLILDGGDIILDKYFDSISKLFKKHNIICNREDKHNEIMLQIIVTAKHWTPYLKRIAYILMNNPYICITSFIEAAVFKSVCPKVYIMNSKSRDEKLIGLLGNEYSKSRTAIVCTNNEEAEKLHKFLANCAETLLIHESNNFAHLQGIKRCWNTSVHGSYPILICTDDVLSDISITNVTWLIHYSINMHSRTRFNYRFSMLLENLQMERCTCKVTIIVDDNSDIQFLSIIKILQRMNVLIPQYISENIEFITATLDKKKENYPICDNIKSWGFCSKQHSCIFRHRIIPEIDAPITDIQINDKVKFRVVSVHDVTHISARVVSYIKFDTEEEIEFSSVEYMHITMKIQEFYSSVENRKRSDTVEVGCICGLEEPVDSFKRVQVLHILKDEETGNPKFVDVRCIDNGMILTKLNAYRLLYIPEKFVKYPVQVMEVFLVGIAPHDEEYVWNNCATDAVYQWFKENIDEKSYVIGTVNLHLGNTIWVNTLEIGTKLIGYKDIIGSSLKTELLNKDHAVENNKHLHEMYQLCKSAGFLDINGYNLSTLINKYSQTCPSGTQKQGASDQHDKKQLNELSDHLVS